MTTTLDYIESALTCLDDRLVDDAIADLRGGLKQASDDAAETKRMREVNNDLLAACEAALVIVRNAERANYCSENDVRQIEAAIARATPTEAK